MKYELRIEFKDIKLFTEFIKNSYKDGVLHDRTQKIVFDKSTANFALCRGLDNLAVRLYNDEIIDGTIRFIITETEENVELHPCSLYCEIENGKYSFSI